LLPELEPELIQGKMTIAEARGQFDLTPSEFEGWVEDGKRGIEDAPNARRGDLREKCERKFKCM
jgi:hypothetical protein